MLRVRRNWLSWQDSHATRVITTVFKALEAFNQNRNDVARTNGADDATHGSVSQQWINQMVRDRIQPTKKCSFIFYKFTKQSTIREI